MSACGVGDLSWILSPEKIRFVPANNPGCPYAVGEKLRFRPAAFSEFIGMSAKTFDLPKEVTGTVTMINEDHRFYRVKYKTPGCIGHECFKY